MKYPIEISENLSSRILTVGPDYRNHRGGVGAVIEVYSRYFEVFNFIESHKNGSAIYKTYIFLICLIRLFYTFLTKRKIKIIHIHGASYGSFYRKFIVFVLSRYIFRKKIIYHIHGGGFKVFYEERGNLSKRLIKALFSDADLVICLSESWREYYEQSFKIKRSIIMPNIIDYPAINKPTAKTDTINFLFLGLICDAKGIFDLIEVIAKNKEWYRSRIKLSVGGNGEIQRLKDLIIKYNIEDIVEFLGWITGREKELALNNCDVYILPSFNEGVPISILESMSYGKAIISTYVGGIPEVVRNGENGLLIKPGELNQIEKAVNFFLENPKLIFEFGAVSEQMVQRHLPHSVMKELTKIYQSLLSNE